MKFELTILGCGSAIPMKNRNCTAQVLNVLERYFLIDCGEGTQHQLRRFGVPYNRINHIFISHLHGDHFYGLIGFLSTLSMQNRRHVMHIYADGRLERLLTEQFRILGTRLAYPLEFHQLDRKECRTLYEDDVLSVSSFPLKHRWEAPSCGFLFREKERPRTLLKAAVEKAGVPIAFLQYLKAGMDYTLPDGTVIPNAVLTAAPPRSRSYAFVSDTLYFEKIADYVKGVDLLYHESTYAHDLLSMAVRNFHSTAVQAATTALNASVGRLILGHYSSRYPDPLPLLQEACEIFPSTFCAEDGKVFDIPVAKRIL